MLALGIASPAVPRPPLYRLDATGSRVVEISNLAAGAFNCALDARASLIRIVTRTFDTAGILPESLVIEAEGERESVVVKVDIDAMPAIDQIWVRRGIQQLTREGTKIYVQMRQCGGAERVVILDRIVAR